MIDIADEVWQLIFYDDFGLHLSIRSQVSWHTQLIYRGTNEVTVLLASGMLM